MRQIPRFRLFQFARLGQVVLLVLAVLLVDCRDQAHPVQAAEVDPGSQYKRYLPPGPPLGENPDPSAIPTHLANWQVTLDGEGFPKYFQPNAEALPAVGAESYFVLLFQSERSGPDGRDEDFMLDANGKEVFAESEDPEESEHDISWDELPEDVRTCLSQFLPDGKPKLIQREVSGAVSLFEAIFQTENGIYELGVLPDGRLMFYEPPPGGPLPAALKSFVFEEQPEAILAQVQCSGGSCSLANGSPIQWLPQP